MAWNPGPNNFGGKCPNLLCLRELMCIYFPPKLVYLTALWNRMHPFISGWCGKPLRAVSFRVEMLSKEIMYMGNFKNTLTYNIRPFNGDVSIRFWRQYVSLLLNGRYCWLPIEKVPADWKKEILFQKIVKGILLNPETSLNFLTLEDETRQQWQDNNVTFCCRMYCNFLWWFATYPFSDLILFVYLWQMNLLHPNTQQTCHKYECKHSVCSTEADDCEWWFYVHTDEFITQRWETQWSRKSSRWRSIQVETWWVSLDINTVQHRFHWVKAFMSNLTLELSGEPFFGIERSIALVLFLDFFGRYREFLANTVVSYKSVLFVSKALFPPWSQ